MSVAVYTSILNKTKLWHQYLTICIIWGLLILAACGMNLLCIICNAYHGLLLLVSFSWQRVATPTPNCSTNSRSLLRSNLRVWTISNNWETRWNGRNLTHPSNSSLMYSTKNKLDDKGRKKGRAHDTQLIKKTCWPIIASTCLLCWQLLFFLFNGMFSNSHTMGL